MDPSESDFLSFYAKYVPRLRPGSEGNYSGFCPIHGEEPGRSKPSLSVNVDTGLWYCFAGCGGGHARSFLQALGKKRTEIDRLTSNLPTRPKKRVKKRQKHTETVLPEKLLGLFDKCPIALINAGFEERILFEHDIGYDEELSRITFPIRARNGDLVGIVGRQKSTDYGKYKVYTTELLKYGLNVSSFKKSNYLWRGEKVLPNAPRRGTIFVVEGFKAALWFVQSGLENVVALMGSHMSDRQQYLLESSGQRIVLCLDNDVAGQKATLKIGHKLSAVQKYVVLLPRDVHQPDDLTEEELQALCSAPKTLSEATQRWHDGSH